MSTPAMILFFVSALTALGGAVATITMKNPLRCAMSLMVTIIAIAGIYLTLAAHLLAALQLLVYAGAVVVLFVFVIMLIGPSYYRTSGDRGALVRAVGAALMGLFTMGIAFTLVAYGAPYVGIAPCEQGAECGQFGGVAGLGGVIYTEGMVPFELVSVLLLVAIVGAIAVARGRTPEEIAAAKARRDALAAEERLREEEERRLSAEVSAHGGH